MEHSAGKAKVTQKGPYQCDHTSESKSAHGLCLSADKDCMIMWITGRLTMTCPQLRVWPCWQ